MHGGSSGSRMFRHVASPPTDSLLKMDWLLSWQICVLCSATLLTGHIPLSLNSWHATLQADSSPWHASFLETTSHFTNMSCCSFRTSADQTYTQNYIDRAAATEQWGQQIARPDVFQPKRPGQEQGNTE